MVGPLDTPSVGRGHLYSASPSAWLQRKILVYVIRWLIGCLLLLAHCGLRLRRAAVPPPHVAPQLGSLLTPRQKRGKDSQRRESDYRVKKKTVLLPGFLFSAIQKQILLFTPSPLHRRRICCPPELPTQRQPECPTFPEHAFVDGRFKKERRG